MLKELLSQKKEFKLPPLPFAADYLSPHISANTLNFHHGKHHQAYVTNLNALIKGTEFEDMYLLEIIKATHNKPEHVGIFNNAAQIWNHAFFWHCISPNGGDKPTGELNDRIVADFGSVENCLQELKKAAVSQFGSGWAWLVLDGNKLKITKTPNADLPMVHNQKALLTIDVWEHSYYLDYQNRRPDYVDILIKHLINWEFVQQNLAV